MPKPRPIPRNRQRVWQLHRVSRGLCSTCGKDPIYKEELCTAHYVKRRISPRVPGMPKDLETARLLGGFLRREVQYALRRDRRNRV